MGSILRETPLARAAQAIAGGSCSCAVARGGELFTAKGVGVKPLMDFLRKDRDFFQGAAVADKVVGRAAALLLLGGGAVAVYGAVLSRGARAVLEAGGVPVFWGAETDYIENRAHTGMCPLEEAVADLDGPEGAFEVLERRIAELMSGGAGENPVPLHERGK